MYKIYELCTDVLGWIVEHNTSNMPSDTYDNICMDMGRAVSKELHKHSECYIVSGRLYTIKVEDAKNLLAIYMGLLDC